MNMVDYISILVIFVSAIMSFFRGFLQELSSIFVWVLGIYFFYRYNNLFSIFSIYIQNKFLKNVVSCFLFFICVLIIKSFSNYFISIFIEQFGISIFNRILGVFFGIFRGIFFLCIIFFVLELLTNISQNYYFKNSCFMPYFNYLIKLVIKYLFKIYISFRN